MTSLNLDELSLKELKAHQKAVERAIASFADREKSAARAKVEALAKELGYDVADLFDLPRKAKRVPEAKYRHPENPRLPGRDAVASRNGSAIGWAPANRRTI